MPYTRKLKFSVNQELVDKQAPSNKLFFKNGFEAVEANIDDLAVSIHEKGWAFSYQFEDNIRSKLNFLATDIACVDVDGGITLKEAQDNQFVKDYCSLLYTTPSHSLEQHRFRLVFILPRTVTDSGEIVAISRSLARRLSGDMAATDAARLFYGSKDCFYQLFDKYITEDVMDMLIQDGKAASMNDSVLNKKSTTNRSMLRLDPDMIVTTSSNQQMLIKDFKKTTSICCPFHDDSNPSAFVGVNKKNKIYIHCKSCNRTWWMESKDDEGQYNFFSFEQSIERIFNKSKNTLHSVGGPLNDFLEPIKIDPKSINILNNKYLEISSLEDGLTFIKSPKGTGKTTYLSEIIKKTIYPFQTLTDYEEATDFETEISRNSKYKILLIGHRQALIGDLCNKLSLNCYLDDKKYNVSEIQYRKRQYGVCLDSLEKIKGLDYDIIVIDEVEQVLSHFLSETVGEKRQGLFRLFCDLIHKTKKVVALDADLGWTSFVTLTSLTHSIQTSLRGKGKKQSVNHKPVHIYINNYQPDKKQILLYHNKEHLFEVVKQRIIDGERVFITSNSKTKINNLYQAINEFLGKNGAKKSIISVTSENSRTKEIQHFIENIKTEVLNYDVVLSSPSLGTGIDITFENSAQEFDCVFGFFENRINSHFEVDQQLARVRHPKEVHVWVCPSRYYFETDLGVVLSDELHHSLVSVTDEGVYNFKNKLSSGIDPFYVMAAMITSQQRASKNSLKYNFINYKIHNGSEIVHVEKDEGLSGLGKQFYELGKHIQETLYVHNILSADILNKYQYTIIKNKFESNDEEVSKTDYYSFIKTHIELFYGAVADDNLVKADKRGNFRQDIIRLGHLLGFLSSLNNKSVFSDIIDLSNLHCKLFKDKQTISYLLYNLLSVTPLISDFVINKNCKVFKDDLHEFSKRVIKYNKTIMTQLEVQVRKDVEENPVRVLSGIIGKIGLKFNKPVSKTVKGQKIYYYTIQEDSYDNIMDIVRRRQTKGMSGWGFVDKQYNFKYTDQELIYLGDLENKYIF